MALLQVKKRLMALAGLLMAFYLLFHMLSNLSFFSPEQYQTFYDIYNQPLIRWPLWILVAASLVFHVIVAVQIRLHNRKARVHAYQHRQHHFIPAWLVSIVITFILLFIVWHMAQMWSFGGADIYRQTLTLFSSEWQVVIYLFGMMLIGLHLQHSLTNVLQTLGKTAKQFYWICTAFVLLLVVGFAIVPLVAYWKA
ncbi:succinate dehydrogenase [Methylophaga nitratireducenticrescens]|uniref:Succinate dehydrogenase cytochrome b subunit n=1 Tax=Methylophaga nitratireducenticrescens TaxID=754476 RepID=I1XJ16_METNJ|nr:succinate dehydrogenase [Methylophaga nitratireducenticrescens]AFI84385.1 succinate dehydrogenase [Methylophaga nitratireducenticrescens]AUZ84457.1 succinate dehydrogenase [Methylophaga nitratireducenticrescens]